MNPAFPATATPAPRPTEPAAPGSSRVVLAELIIAVSMTTIDQTIVSLAAPNVQTGLNISGSAVEWAVNAYLLAAAAAFPLAGRLADVIGYRRMMIAGIIVFALASAACGATPTGSHADVPGWSLRGSSRAPGAP